jgi:hypothetical protein
MMRRIKKTVGSILVAVGFVFAQSAPQWQNLFPEYTGLAFGGDKFVAVSADGFTWTTGDGAVWSQSFAGNGGSVLAVAYDGVGQFVALQNSSNYLQAGDGAGWTVTSTGIQPSSWKHMVYGKGTFVAVDGEGYTALFNEVDGWMGADAGVESLSHAAFGAGAFVVVGDGGIRLSNDARGWRGTSVSSGFVSVAAYGADKFVALLKNGGGFYTSGDGASWTSASSSDVPAGMADMIFAGGKFVAVGAKGKGCWSEDGTAWKSSSGLNEADDFKAVKYGNNIFLALGAKGSVYKSADGSSWTRLAGNSVASYKQIVYGDGKFVAVGDSGVSVSSDGKSWDIKSSVKNLVGVAFGASAFVAVDSCGTIISSGNGDVWSEEYKVEDAILTSVAFGDGVFIVGGRTEGAAAASRAVMYTSADGKAWDLTDDGAANWLVGQYPVSICFGGGKFLAACRGNKVLKTCAASASGVKYWSNVSTLPDLGEDAYNMVSAAYAGGKFVVLGKKGNGEAVILSSADAGTWAPPETVPQEIKGMKSATFAKDTYIAVADSGKIYAKVNGAWVLQKKTTNRNLSTIYTAAHAGKDVILAAGANGAILYSDAAPTSIRHASAPRVAPSSKGGVMSLERSRRSPAVTLSFAPNSAGTIAVYSLSGRQIYKARLGVGERSVRLPERVMSSGSVIVRYSGGGRVVSQRFQFVR